MPPPVSPSGASDPALEPTDQSPHVLSSRRFVRRTVAVLSGAILASVLLRTLVFEAFHIPSPSMEEALLEGDFVLVSKLHYGPRLPGNISVPFTDISLPGLGLPTYRLPGVTRVGRNDAVVFNHPEGEGPLDGRTHLVKRSIGLPGDTVEIRRKVVFINGRPLTEVATVQYTWVVYFFEEGDELPADFVGREGVERLKHHSNPPRTVMNAGLEMAHRIGQLPFVAGIRPDLRSPREADGPAVFPSGKGYGRDFYGPVYVPRRGDTVLLTSGNRDVYARLIARHEGRQVRRTGEEGLEIDGRTCERYTFEKDYYFLLGDNRDDSVDSRHWGLLPADHVVGKAVVVYFSWDPERNRPRVDRLLRRVE